VNKLDIVSIVTVRSEFADSALVVVPPIVLLELLGIRGIAQTTSLVITALADGCLELVLAGLDRKNVYAVVA
jgi:hypothetical protein